VSILKDLGVGFGIGLGAAAYTVGVVYGIDKVSDLEFAFKEWEVEYEEYMEARKNHTGYNETRNDPKGPNMNFAKKSLVSTKNFVARNKVAISVVVTTAVTAVAMDKLIGAAVKDRDVFLEEKGLMNEYINWVADAVVNE
jgi:hypothetical protein